MAVLFVEIFFARLVALVIIFFAVQYRRCAFFQVRWDLAKTLKINLWLKHLIEIFEICKI